VACAGQAFVFDIQNTACPGTITFTVTGNAGSFADEISWEIVSNTTGAVVATAGLLPGPPTSVGSGGTVYANNQVINVTVGPLSAATLGTAYTIYIYDDFGDGLDGAGVITVTSSTGTVLASFNDANFDAAQTNQGFSTPVNISAATAVVTTPSGTQNIALASCADLNLPITFSNPNFCTTVTRTVSWSITCNQSGAVLSSGSQNITVYPSLPTQVSDLVSINFNSSTCAWDVVPNNDCAAAAIGTIFTISPNPATAVAPGASGNQTFSITYNGPSGGPSCCATGGPAVPITYTTPALTSSVTVENSPFGGVNNSAYVTTGPAGVGGQAVSGGFSVNFAGYQFNPPGTANTDFWITVYVDGIVVSDVMYTAAPQNLNFTLAQINAAGATFNSSSVIEVYVYPNTFNNSGVNTTFVPTGWANADGTWTASTIEINNVLFTFTQTQPSPANCTFTATRAYSCPACNVANAGLVVGTCNNNGTGSNAADDTYTITLNPTGSALAAGYTVSGFPAGYAGATTGTYGSATTFGPFLISAGTFTLTVEDNGASACNRNAPVTPPASCSNACVLASSGLAVGACNNAGTGSNPADDTYTITLNPTGTNLAAGYAVTGFPAGYAGITTGNYGSATTFGPFLISAGSFNLSIEDNGAGACNTTASVTAPASCSNSCSLSANGLLVGACNDNGTPSNPADDRYTITLNPSGVNLAVGYTISGFPSGYAGPTTGNYGTTTTFGPFLISSGNFTLNIEDNAPTGCSTTASVSAPASCSNACLLNAAGLVVGTCNNNGTNTIPADDTYTITLNPGGLNLAAGYTVSGFPAGYAGSSTGNYGAATTFGPFLISAGNFVLSIEDNGAGACSFSASVTAPASCSNVAPCNLTGSGLIVTPASCNNQATTATADDTYSFTLNPTGTQLGATYTVSGLPGGATAQGTYGTASSFGPYPIISGTLNLSITDNSTGTCTIAVSVTPPSNAPLALAAYSPQQGTCVAPPQITLPAGYVCSYTYLSGQGLCAGNGPVANYCIVPTSGSSGQVNFSVVTPCGQTETVGPLNFNCTICQPDNGNTWIRQ
jgi:hypothetical protein